MSWKTGICWILSTIIYSQRAGLAWVVIAITGSAKSAFDIRSHAADGSHAARPSINRRFRSPRPGRARFHERYSSYAHSILPLLTSWSSFESREFCHASR